MRDIQTAKTALGSASYDPRRLILIHAGVTCALSLLLAVLDFFLAQGIGSTGGLSGMGTRAAINTARTVLGYSQSIFTPFWSAGYIYCTLSIARNAPARPYSLWQGFRLWRPVLTVSLLVPLFCSLVSVGVFLAVTQLLTFTPLIAPVAELVLPYLSSDPASVSEAMAIMDDATALAITKAMLPLMITAFLITALVVLLYSYRYRLALLRALDVPQQGGRAAMWVSRILMRGNKKALFLLDLRFWWYYLLSTLLGVIPFGDLILPMLGVNLPWNQDVMYFIFFIVYLLCELILAVTARNTVFVSYAAFYDRLAAEYDNNEKG